MAGSRCSSSVIRMTLHLSALLSSVLVSPSGGLSPSSNQWPSAAPRSVEAAKQPWQKQSYSFPFIEVQGCALIGPAWVIWPSLNQSMVRGIQLSDWLGWGHKPGAGSGACSFWAPSPESEEGKSPHGKLVKKTWNLSKQEQQMPFFVV